MKSTAETKQNLFARLRKKIALVTRERDSYRLQLDSYEKDLTVSISNLPTSQSQVYKERIDTLENTLKEYREYNDKLEADLQNANPDLYADFPSGKFEKLTKLEQEVEKFKVENDMLRKKCDRLEEQLEGFMLGQDNCQGQALHMINNPLADTLAQREKLAEKLQIENDKLKRHIKNIEAGLEASKLGDSTLNVQEVKELQEQLAAKEAQKQHIKDVFKASMTEFRQVIYMLFGYKIDRPTNSLYKLTSMYAASNEDQLCFQVSAEGTLNFLETDFSNTLSHLMDLHLMHQKSIPLFLSALTMELYTNSTLPTATVELS